MEENASQHFSLLPSHSYHKEVKYSFQLLSSIENNALIIFCNFTENLGYAGTGHDIFMEKLVKNF